MITSTKHVIAVNDLAASIAYYRDVLGCEIREIGDPGWRFCVRGAFCVMAGECPGATPPADTGDHAYFAYVVFDSGIDEYFALVSDNGAALIKPVRDEPWGMREFGVRTIDGHRIMFGQACAASSPG
jgi:uncharacterized glyoxalase superfamily protein PhnB